MIKIIIRSILIVFFVIFQGFYEEELDPFGEAASKGVYSSSSYSQIPKPTLNISGGFAFLCPLCKVSFEIYELYENHLTKHSCPDRFVCPFCEKRFKAKAPLKYHVAIHTGDSAFSCPYCEYKCIRGNDLKRHLLTHTGEKPHLCLFCEKTFALKHQLNCHVKNKHMNLVKN